jgi:peptidyl-prolyl cis-trans isomerase C
MLETRISRRRPMTSAAILAAGLVGGLWSLNGVRADSPPVLPAPTPPTATPEATPAPTPVAPSAILIKAKGIEITTADVLEELKQQPGRLRAVRANREALKAVVEKMLRTELLAQEAERRGYGTHAMVQQAVKEEAVQQLNRAEIDEKFKPSAVPAADVKAYYDSQGEQFHRPGMRRARHILLETQAQAVSLLAEARTADERGFQKLARKNSVDTETKQRGGDLRFFSLAENGKRRDAPIHEAIRKATFKLKKLGDTVSKPVKVDGRYSIIRLTGIREERNTTLDDADASIRTRLWRQKRRNALTALMSKLRREQKPQIFAQRIQDIDLSDVAGRPPGFSPDPVDRKPRKRPKKSRRPEGAAPDMDMERAKKAP